MEKKYDEYNQGDPYKVKDNINHEFHKRRLDMTLNFVLRACKILSTKVPKILDVGCGEGYITHRIKQQIPEADIYGIDNSTLAIKTAKKFHGINFVFGDAMNLPFDNNCFDIVVCNNLIEHVNSPNEVLAEIHNKLKKSGYLIVSTPSRYRIENLIKLLLTGKMSFMSKLHFKEYSIGEMINLLETNGFEITTFVSNPMKYRSGKIKKFIIHQILKKILYVVPLKKFKHGLESTVFYLARKEDDQE